MVRAIAIGLLVSVLVISSTGQQAAKAAVSLPDIGRYQIVESTVKSATFLLDTTSGRVWILNRYSELFLEPTVWEPMTRLDTKEEMDRFLKVHPPKSTLKP